MTTRVWLAIPTGFVPVNTKGVPTLIANPSTNGGVQMYKTMQYLYVAKKFKTVKASFLFFKDDFAKYRLDTLKATDGGTVAGRRYDVTGVNSRMTAGILLNGTLKGGFNYIIGGYLQGGKNSLVYVKLASMDKAQHTATWAYLMVNIKPEIFSSAIAAAKK